MTVDQVFKRNLEKIIKFSKENSLKDNFEPQGFIAVIVFNTLSEKVRIKKCFKSLPIKTSNEFILWIFRAKSDYKNSKQVFDEQFFKKRDMIRHRGIALNIKGLMIAHKDEKVIPKPTKKEFVDHYNSHPSQKQKIAEEYIIEFDITKDYIHSGNISFYDPEDDTVYKGHFYYYPENEIAQRFILDSYDLNLKVKELETVLSQVLEVKREIEAKENCEFFDLYEKFRGKKVNIKTKKGELISCTIVAITGDKDFSFLCHSGYKNYMIKQNNIKKMELVEDDRT